MTGRPPEPEYVYEWKNGESSITFSWLGDVDLQPDRVYALAFTPNGQILLVTDDNWRPACWLPGGHIEAGETPEQALARELIEEANAVMRQSVKIGTQQAVTSEGRRSFQDFYWCRITLNQLYAPALEITERHLVSPDAFLDTLFWGRQDPKAEMLLKLALAIEANQRPPVQ